MIVRFAAYGEIAMRFKMPITARKIRNHFHYSFWKYLLLVVLAVFGWNLLYTTTRYRSPENLKVEFYAEGNTMASDALQGLADKIHKEIMPEMEEVTATIVTFDDAYGDMQLTVWVSAGQGDVYLLSKDRFKTMANNDATLDLQPLVDDGTLQANGLDLTKGYVTNTETGKKALMGIPADSLTGLEQYGLITKDMVLCVLSNNGNDTYTLKFLEYLLTNMRSAAEAPTASTSATPAATIEPMSTPSPEVSASPTVSALPTVTQ